MSHPGHGSPAEVVSFEIDISDSTTVSDAIDIGHYKLAGFIFPTMTGTAITFQVSDAIDGTYVVLNDEAGAAVSITIVSAQATGMGDALAALAPFRFVKLVSGSAEGADRTIKAILKE